MLAGHDVLTEGAWYGLGTGGIVPQSARFFAIAVGVAFVLAIVIGRIGVDMSANPPVYYGFVAGVGVLVAALVGVAVRVLGSRKPTPSKVQDAAAPPAEAKR